MTENRLDLEQPAIVLEYRGAWRQKADRRVYALDQELARSRVPYHLERADPSWKGWSVHVSQKHSAMVQSLIDRLQASVRDRVELRDRGWWNDIILSTKRSRHTQDQPWVFACYSEETAGSERTYTAFLFANAGRNVFGKKEWTRGERPSHPQLEKLARRVLSDETLRNQLLSDDPDLPVMWRNR